jgi:hypothetical protein
MDDIKWAQDTLPDPSTDDKFNWEYGFGWGSTHCDYGPSTVIWLILVNAGVDKRDASSICPWKTGIEIRSLDNAVLYNTYQHHDEL